MTFVGRNDVNHAIDGDTVEVVITKVADRIKGTSAEAKIIDIFWAQPDVSGWPVGFG